MTHFFQHTNTYKFNQFFYSLTASNCLENKPENLGELLVQTLPGKVLTLEEQCLARGGKPCVVGNKFHPFKSIIILYKNRLYHWEYFHFQFNSTICWKLHCTKSMTNMKCVGKAPAAEGSTCGDGLVRVSFCANTLYFSIWYTFIIWHYFPSIAEMANVLPKMKRTKKTLL